MFFVGSQNGAQLESSPEFRFLMMSSSLCRIWTYESKICTGLQSRKLAEAILTFFNDEVARKCVLQDFVILSFTFHTVDGKNPAPIRVYENVV